MFVISLVETQATFLFETLETNFAGELFEIGMASHMVGESLLASEGSVALVTLVGLHSGVYPFVLFEVILAGETFLTEPTHVRPIASVGLKQDQILLHR